MSDPIASWEKYTETKAIIEAFNDLIVGDTYISEDNTYKVESINYIEHTLFGRVPLIGSKRIDQRLS